MVFSLLEVFVCYYTAALIDTTAAVITFNDIHGVQRGLQTLQGDQPQLWDFKTLSLEMIGYDDI